MMVGFLFAGEESVNMEIITKPGLQPSSEKIQFVDRLAISITKRKRSTPQKFLGGYFFFNNMIFFLKEFTHQTSFIVFRLFCNNDIFSA